MRYVSTFNVFCIHLEKQYTCFILNVHFIILIKLFDLTIKMINHIELMTNDYYLNIIIELMCLFQMLLWILVQKRCCQLASHKKVLIEQIGIYMEPDQPTQIEINERACFTFTYYIEIITELSFSLFVNTILR